MITQDYQRGGTQKSTYLADEVTQWPCPLCGATETQFIKLERKSLKIVSCKHCDLIRVSPRIHRPEEIYQGDSEAYTEEFRMVCSGKFPHHRDRNYLKDLKSLEAFKPAGNFLDVGTNTGSFLRLARGRGWQLTGIEPSHNLAELARRWWGLEIQEGFIESLNLTPSHYDIVTLTDVFEHVVNPQVVLAAVRKAIRPDGILFIKVPNARFNLLKFRVRKWLGKKDADDFDSYEHVVHYTEETLRKMVSACGFEVFQIKIDPPVQLPVWHHYVGRYYQHKSPFWMGWKTYSGRELCYRLSIVERFLLGKIGWLAPNIGCFARLRSN